ncbi:hypothetical protein BGZ92_010298 [Podila epicladia]|nr:hypothetical protein BGZ92_010298 [Podila epicladia]
MRLASILRSPGTALVVVGLATILSQALLTSASSDNTNDENHRHHQQQQQQQQQQRRHQEEFIVEELGTVNINTGLHKNGGVDFRTEGELPRIDFEHISSVASSSASDYEATEASIDEQSNEETDLQSKCLLFSDEFDKLDRSVWRPDRTLTGGGNYEFQSYDLNVTNTFVRDGIFYIRPTLTENRIGIKALRETGVLDFWGSDPGTQCTGNYDYGCFRVAGAGGNILNPVQSGMVRSVNAFKFRYGKVVVRAKMPKGKWIWPYGTWPASGEIDLLESRGNGPEYPGGGYDTVSSTLHWGPSYDYNRFQLTHAEYTLPRGQSFADEFHVFTMDWTPEGVKTYVDDDLLLNVTFNNMFKKGKFPAWMDNPWEGSDTAPFDQEFYLIMNVAVGGSAGYFPDGVGNKPWSDKSEHAVNEFYAAKDDWYPSWGPENGLDRALAVDYIRVYKHDC